jgi:tetratricopeptide (TPR) repeat protein
MQKLSEITQQLAEESDYSWDLLETIENLDIQPKEWQQMAHVLPRQPMATKLGWRFRVLLDTCSGRSKELLTYLPDSQLQTWLKQDPILRLHIAQAYLGLWQVESAYTWLETVEPPKKPRHAFWYWSTKALIAVYLEQPFEQAFEKASALCQGHELGAIYLNWAFAFDRNKQPEKAVFYWQEALHYLRLPSFALALTHYNLGLVFLTNLNPQAQHQFDWALKISRYTVAANLRPAILCGLGDWQRLHGHHRQAKNFYHRGLIAAQKQSIVKDQINSYTKLGYLCLLTTDLETAFEYLKKAIALIPDVYSDTWVYTIEALVHLRRTDLAAAENAMTRAISLGNIATERARVIRAELERQKGNTAQAMHQLENLDLTNVGARETVLVLPELWTWAKTQGINTPEPITEQKRVFKVQALDQLEVWAGQKKVQLPERSAEILVYLLHYKTRNIDELISALYFEELDLEIDSKLWAIKFKQYKKDFNQNLKRLREALYWKDIITLKNGQYSINLEDAIWEVGWITQPNQFKNLFLKFIQRRWAKDITEPF